MSRRTLLRRSIGGGVALWLLELTAGTLGFLWPNLAGGFGGVVKIGTLSDLKLANGNLPIAEGFPAYVPDARAYIVLVDPNRQEFVPGDGHDAATGRRSTSGRSTSAARISAAARTRASRTSGSSARATGRATTGSASRPTASGSGRRHGRWTGSRRT